MLNQIPQFFLTLLAQGSGAAPPAPKMGPGAPPPGLEVPVDNFTWVLAIAAIAIAVIYFYKLRKVSKLSN